MAQYSSGPDGQMTDWHLAHLGGLILRGAGLTILEATAVTPNGRGSPEDVGLWDDSQIESIKRIVDFAHSQGQKIGIQLAHAGRKATGVAPWISRRALATENVGGWPDDVWGPSAIAYSDEMAMPHAMSLAEIEEFKAAWVTAVKRAVQTGVDVIDIHGGHGYLLSSFNSPVTNRRTDQYGGSFENRTRLTREIVHLTRQAIPDSMPLFLRLSVTEWLEHEPSFEDTWTIDSTVQLVPSLASLGVDLLDVSSGGNHPLQRVYAASGYQTPLAQAVKAAIGDKLLVSAVGLISEGKFANQLLEEVPALDAIMVGRTFLKNPGLVWAWAEELGVETRQANQIRWIFLGKSKK